MSHQELEMASMRNRISFNFEELSKVMEGEPIMDVFTLRERESLRRNGITTRAQSPITQGSTTTLTPEAKALFEAIAEEKQNGKKN